MGQDGDTRLTNYGFPFLLKISEYLVPNMPARGGPRTGAKVLARVHAQGTFLART